MFENLLTILKSFLRPSTMIARSLLRVELLDAKKRLLQALEVKMEKRIFDIFNTLPGLNELATARIKNNLRERIIETVGDLIDAYFINKISPPTT